MSRTSPRLLAALAALLPLAGTASEPAKPKALPPIYDTMTIGKREIDYKKKVCKASNRRLFINFGTNDCAACRVVNDAMNEPKFFGPFTRQFVPAYIDVSAGSKNLELLKDYRVDPAKGLPAVVILDEEGKFSEAAQEGEVAREAAKGVEAVQLWIIKRFYEDK